jgi:hypothetical protein
MHVLEFTEIEKENGKIINYALGFNNSDIRKEIRTKGLGRKASLHFPVGHIGSGL